MAGGSAPAPPVKGGEEEAAGVGADAAALVDFELTGCADDDDDEDDDGVEEEVEEDTEDPGGWKGFPSLFPGDVGGVRASVDCARSPLGRAGEPDDEEDEATEATVVTAVAAELSGGGALPAAAAGVGAGPFNRGLP